MPRFRTLSQTGALPAAVAAIERLVRILDERRVVPKSYTRELKGISGALTVYEIPARAG